MNDSPAKERPRFQLHLSTCVVLMVVAGALMWANLHFTSYVEPISQFSSQGIVKYGYLHRRGWPWEMSFGVEETDATGAMEWTGKEPVFTPPAAMPLPTYRLDGSRWEATSVMKNGCVALSTLVIAAYACESLIRRRGRQRRAVKEPAP